MREPNLPAGPELDRLIAERVMGWKWDAGQNWYAGSSGVGTSPRTGFWPSSNIAHAWEVVKHLSKSWDISISLDRGAGVQVVLHSGVDQKDPFPGCVDIPVPLAICRAALTAVGHE